MSGNGQNSNTYKQGDLLERRRASDGIRNWYRNGELVGNSLGNLLKNPKVNLKNSSNDKNQELRISFDSDKSFEKHVRQNIENFQEIFIDKESLTWGKFNDIFNFSSNQTFDYSIKDIDRWGRITDSKHFKISDKGVFSFNFDRVNHELFQESSLLEITITDSSGESFKNNFIVNLVNSNDYNEVYSKKNGGDSIYWNDVDKTPLLVKKVDNSDNLDEKLDINWQGNAFKSLECLRCTI